MVTSSKDVHDHCINESCKLDKARFRGQPVLRVAEMSVFVT